MLTFNYQARDTKTNKIIKSTVKAENKNAAGKLLLEQGLIPIKITESNTTSFIDDFLNRITIKDKLVFSRQLATLIAAGLPLTQALRTVEEQTQNKKLKAVIFDIVASVEGGKNLVDAFSKHDKIFDKLYISLIMAGEASGTLDVALQRISAQQEKDAEMASRIRGAMTYPIIVLFVIGGVLAFMLFQVVPQVSNLYKDMKKTLPPLTQMMVSSADFLTHFWWLILIILGVGFYFLKKYFQTKPGTRIKHSLILNIPGISSMSRKMYMARFMRTAELLLKTGVSMLDSLAISAGAMGNVIVEETINKASEKVKSGKSLSYSLRDQDYILPLVPQMINIGEQSGKIAEMMAKTAKVYEDELDEQMKALSTMIEPILMVFLAVVAGGMVGAILMPIYGLVNNV